jgi:hypothetical protein
VVAVAAVLAFERGVGARRRRHFGLVLLRHKFIGTRRAIEARQHGHRGKRLTRASMMRRRTVAIEFGT